MQQSYSCHSLEQLSAMHIGMQIAVIMPNPNQHQSQLLHASLQFGGNGPLDRILSYKRNESMAYDRFYYSNKAIERFYYSTKAVEFNQ